MILTPSQAQAVVACMRALGTPELAGAKLRIEFDARTTLIEQRDGSVAVLQYTSAEGHSTQAAFAAAYGLDDDGLMPF